MTASHLLGELRDDESAALLRAAMVDRLLTGTPPLPKGWESAFRAVPRHPFTPAVFRPSDIGYTVRRADGDRDRWLREVYADEPLVTQLDGCRDADTFPDGALVPAGAPTCSSSQPSLMALMLDALDVHEGMRVLEIGTGTGYNAALLAARLGPESITSVEYDGRLARRARAALHAMGFPVATLHADGMMGAPRSAPYDRLISTCSFPSVPTAWLHQVKAGGLILVNLYRRLGGGILALLRVEDANHASGNLLPDHGGFMPTRTHPNAEVTALLDKASTHYYDTDAKPRPTDLTCEALNIDGFRVLAALHVPAYLAWADDGRQTWLLHPDGSYACHTIDDDGGQSVTEHGTHQLWTDLEHAWHQWNEHGQPDRHTFGISVTTGQETFWLGTIGQHTALTV
jgi:methyltransferase of ATP-grasp peptide maturase system